jgi:hypothetical protein
VGGSRGYDFECSLQTPLTSDTAASGVCDNVEGKVFVLYVHMLRCREALTDWRYYDLQIQKLLIILS